MCGRFKRSVTWAEYYAYLTLTGAVPNAPPRYNIAPTDPVYAVRRAPAGAPELVTLRWGLIPAWAKDAKGGAMMINARADTIAEKPAYREAFVHRRCLVLADGFYEWKLEGKIKQPYLITRRDGGPFAFAGLWERWQRRGPGGGEPIESCTIVTTDANARLRPIHDRMPVILARADHDAWLGAADPAAAKMLLQPYPDADLAVTRVSTWVNSVKNDDAACAEPERRLL
ncbi:MAG: SOS response-associated peptidase [Alphaproteobacteria bacterium]|nr:SOS response-associated peptidase [Alphaproteobacteria bacterium]